jgi:hypothetical protein
MGEWVSDWMGKCMIEWCICATVYDFVLLAVGVVDVFTEVERGRSAMLRAGTLVSARSLVTMYVYLHDNVTQSGEHLAP